MTKRLADTEDETEVGVVQRRAFYKAFPIQYVKRYIEASPEFEIKPVHVNGEYQRDYKAVVNQNTGKVVAIVSKRFQLIQHKTVMNAFLDVLTNHYTESEIEGFYRWTDTRAYLTVYFRTVEPFEKDYFKLGLLVTNGVDGSMAIWTKFCGLRLICTNGLVSRETIEVVKTIHTSTDFSDFMERLIGRFERVIERIDGYASKTFLMFDEWRSKEIPREEAIKEVAKIDWLPKKALGIIKYFLPKEEKVNLYDLYNAITNYISNYSGKNIQGRTEDLIRAEKVIQQMANALA